jgi:hypothetical protein
MNWRSHPTFLPRPYKSDFIRSYNSKFEEPEYAVDPDCYLDPSKIKIPFVREATKREM